MPSSLAPTIRFALLATVSVSGPTLAQPAGFPAKPVRIVVPVPPGGSVDTVARLIAPRMSELMGQPVVIDNRAGASTNIGTEHVAKSAPDGYTLPANAIPLVANPSLYSKLPYNVERDFAAVTLVATTPHVMVVHPSLPVRGIQDFIKLARAKPGAIHYSSSGAGSNLHIAAELFKNLTKTDHDFIAKAAHTPNVKERVAKDGAEVVVNSPETFRKFLIDDLQRWATVIKEGNIKLD